ncbi:hypothetical protein FHP05_00670 [Cerasibacillus terrae]|uniref:Uncharacterized protein n=1 Tax=Cerasibacillus terrae TaxID=2498845 RepID=A0A5C8P2R1_9BACI|nr:hypothetical protein [Cerasibacillus terrae]TXL67564.1 hypothetical protein FHP05_00670 [Cerasibacillus terrae]
MIVPIVGNVTYPITLDPTVWIFDDRKILLEEAFLHTSEKEMTEEEKYKNAIQNNDWYHHEHIKPPVNKSISKKEREEALKNSYVMPIHHFLEHAEINSDAKNVSLETNKGNINISLNQLWNSYLLFAVNGKIVSENGPVHLYFKDGSNQDKPIKGISKIIIE